jgi:MFS family permease
MTERALVPDGTRWVVLAVTIAATTVGMMGFAAVFPLLNLWIRDLGITRAQGGLLSGFWYLPGIVVALPAGWAFDRYPIKRVLGVCWGFILVGTVLMALAPSFWVLCAGRLVFAIGMNAHMIGAPKLIGTWFAGRRELGFVMGLYTMAFTAGVFLSLNVLGSIGSTAGWRPALSLLAGLSALGVGLILVIPRQEAISAAGGPPVRFRPLELGLGAWILALAYFGYSIGTEGYLTFTPDFLVGRGFELARASSIVGAYALLALVLKPILSSFLRPDTGIPFVVAATLFALASVGLLFAPGVPPLASSGAMGLSLAFGMPALFALPTFLLGAARSGQGYGLYQLFYSLGFFAQPLVGLVADRSGGYGAGYVVVAGYCLVGLLVALPAVRRLRPRETS